MYRIEPLAHSTNLLPPSSFLLPRIKDQSKDNDESIEKTTDGFGDRWNDGHGGRTDSFGTESICADVVHK